MKLSLISALVLGASMLYPSESTAMVKGADVSWLTQMEQSGYRFYNDSGKQQDLLLTLKQHGINAIRLRVWVNPAGGWNGLNDVIAKAKRAKAAGLDIMIDFHYSDSWADPGKQTKPAAWQRLYLRAVDVQRLLAYLQLARRPEAGRHHAKMGTSWQRDQQWHAVG
ncbi:glycosyl hydrolase 53 family protein [Aeromonas salmonicida]|uniref:glycosyl hydrolase 53 family protein n=1 Tax=Aeromonas salmonicida TaxID=645 RepID=UPI00240E6C28|nr:glycosyl hydrolase 53 family protein [Aeromonas salmonicida]WFC15891.1 arabinogalactan endo-1,4-beta-galactosidase [Aeromonas salmonicida]